MLPVLPPGLPPVILGPARALRRRAMRGVLAVELAILLFLVVALYAVLFEAGRLVHREVVLSGAVRDVARLVATAPYAELATAGAAEPYAELGHAILVAKGRELQLDPDVVQSMGVRVTCNDWPCGVIDQPTRVEVLVTASSYVTLGAWLYPHMPEQCADGACVVHMWRASAPLGHVKMTTQ